MKNGEITWTRHGAFISGKAISNSGKEICITEANTRKGRYFTVYVAGDERQAATRATIEEVNRIIRTR